MVAVGGAVYAAWMMPQTAIAAFLLAFPALFSIVNPLAGGLIFRTVTNDRTHEQRLVLARLVGVYAFLVMTFCVWAGSYVLAFFGITLPALRIAGGLVVASSGWSLLNAPERREARKQKQAATAGVSADVAFFPLTMPFTTGPGTIAVAVALGAEHPALAAGAIWFFLGLTGAAAAVAATVWIAYRYADAVSALLSQSGQRTVTRLAAFLLLCIGVQIVLAGVTDVLQPMLAAR
jgi:multiple antibiotic resistance protein